MAQALATSPALDDNSYLKDAPEMEWSYRRSPIPPHEMAKRDLPAPSNPEDECVTPSSTWTATSRPTTRPALKGRMRCSSSHTHKPSALGYRPYSPKGPWLNCYIQDAGGPKASSFVVTVASLLMKPFLSLPCQANPIY
ncbi:hypothetical protein BU17DRAFT_72651 [Hysterangium stoloniferum]|nr:hypothetical protein BU17DRAFT_72651 [Hysterangium stoloniferum]